MANITQVNSQNSSAGWRSGILAHRPVLHGDLGQAMVELALIMPIFVLLIVGAAEFGHLAYAAIEVTNAARAGVAYGSQTHITASDDVDIQLAAIKDGSNVTNLSATSSHFCSCSTGGSVDCTTALTSCPSPARIIEYVQANTT